MVRHVAFALCLLAAAAACGQEAPAKSQPDDAAKHRLELMLGALADCRLASKGISADGLAIVKSPLLRYHDPTRGMNEGTEGLMDACLWRIGQSGRPTALVTLEIYGKGPGRAILSYEFLSLTPLPLDLSSPRGPTWAPSSTPLVMKPFSKAPPPADSARARLIQMRQLARRFSVQEELPGNNKIDCRLLAQPIDRYAGGPETLLDGAIFAFANGTNPELGLLLECSEKDWTYGIVRLSSAALQAKLDGEVCFEAAKVVKSGARDAYVGMAYPIEWKE